jgi:hypothetical protein
MSGWSVMFGKLLPVDAGAPPGQGKSAVHPFAGFSHCLSAHLAKCSQVRGQQSYCTSGESERSRSMPSIVAAPASRLRYWRNAVTKLCWRSVPATAPRTDS